MNQDEYEIRLEDMKEKLATLRKAEMAYIQAKGEYEEAMTNLIRFIGIDPNQGPLVLPEVIEKLGPRLTRLASPGPHD